MLEAMELRRSWPPKPSELNEMPFRMPRLSGEVDPGGGVGAPAERPAAAAGVLLWPPPARERGTTGLAAGCFAAPADAWVLWGEGLAAAAAARPLLWPLLATGAAVAATAGTFLETIPPPPLAVRAAALLWPWLGSGVRLWLAALAGDRPRSAPRSAPRSDGAALRAALPLPGNRRGSRGTPLPALAAAPRRGVELRLLVRLPTSLKSRPPLPRLLPSPPPTFREVSGGDARVGSGGGGFGGPTARLMTRGRPLPVLLLKPTPLPWPLPALGGPAGRSSSSCGAVEVQPCKGLAMDAPKP
jgi:hypothetical protein